MADLLTDEDLGLPPPGGDPPRVMSDSDMGIAMPPKPYQPPTDRPQTLQERGKEVYGFQDLPVRGTLLPFGKTEGGDVTVATPQFLKDMLESALLPGHVMQGGSYTPEDATRFTMDWLVPATSKVWPDTSRAVTPRRLTESAPSTETLKAQSLYAQAQATKTGAKFSPDAQNRLLAELTKVAERNRVRPGRADSIVSLLKTVKDDLGRSPDVADLIQTRQFIQDAITDGSPTSKAIGMQMLDVFDDFLDDVTLRPKPGDVVGGVTDDITKNLAQFRSLWSKAKKSEMIEAAIDKAARGASGLENGIRNEFRSILNNPKKVRGFTMEERRVMDMVAKGEGANFWKALGKFGYGLHGNKWLGGFLGQAAGGAAFGPAGAVAVPAMGAVAASKAEQATLQNAMTLRAMTATGQVPQNPLVLKMLENSLTKRGTGPLAGTAVKTPERPYGNPVTLPNGSTVYLDPNIL